jgi:hypothetical protein
MFHQIIGKKNVVNYWIPPLEWWTSLKQGTLGFPLIFVFFSFVNFFDI